MSEKIKGEKNPMYGKSHTKEARELMSKSRLGKKFTETHKKNMSASKMGEKNPMYGKRPSEETIQKTVLKTKGQKRTEEQRRHISESLMGHVESEATREKIRQKALNRKGYRKHVLCIETNEEFNSSEDAAKFVNKPNIDGI